MPNWNSSRLTVTDLTDEQRTELASHIEAEDLLEHYVPQPEGMTYSLCESRPEDQEEIKINMDLYGSKDGYSWCVENHGTKWDIADATVESVGSELIAYFNTAWSPPIEGLRRVSEKFPGVTFVLTYQEDGCDFCGAALFKDGLVEENEGLAISDLADAWYQENHPEDYKKAEAEEWDGEVSESLNEAWYEVSGEVIEEYTLSLAAELGAKPIDPELYACKREKEQEQHALFRQLIDKMKTEGMDSLTPEECKAFMNSKV